MIIYYFTLIIENSDSFHILTCYGFQCTMAVQACNDPSYYSKITGHIFIHPSIHPFLFPMNLNIISLTQKCKKVHNSTEMQHILPPYESTLNS